VLTANRRWFADGPAIRASIGVMNGAFAVVGGTPELTSDQRTAIVDLISWSIGTDGLVAGQEQDLNEAPHLATAAAIEAMHGRKTGALFAAACAIGSVVAGDDAARRERAKEAGYKLGVAFQTLDDLLDQYASEADALKDVGKDAIAGKPTLVALLGCEAALDRAEHPLDEAVELLGCGDAQGDLHVFISDLRASFLSRFEGAEPLMDRHGHG